MIKLHSQRLKLYPFTFHEMANKMCDDLSFIPDAVCEVMSWITSRFPTMEVLRCVPSAKNYESESTGNLTRMGQVTPHTGQVTPRGVWSNL